MWGKLGKLIVAKGFNKLPKVQQIAQSGHTGHAGHKWPNGVLLNMQHSNLGDSA